MRLYFLLLFGFSVSAQNPANTEIFLFDIDKKNQKITIENGENISQNPGYDNQPSFYSGDTLIYSKNRDKQTDIAGFSIKESGSFWMNNTGAGSEYSPQRIPGTMDVAAVRLDTTGLQLLYNYNLKTSFIH
jgi:hypothetical protein